VYKLGLSPALALICGKIFTISTHTNWVHNCVWMCVVNVAYHKMYYHCQACTIRYIQTLLHIRTLLTNLRAQKHISWYTTSNLVVPSLSLALCWYFDMTHPLPAVYTPQKHRHAWCSDWEMLMEGLGKAQTGPGQTYSGCYWWNWYQEVQVQIENPVFAGTPHWLLSYWMIVLRFKTSTSSFDPFPCCGSLLGVSLPFVLW